MKISTFQAKDMREALQMVKDQLGADAVILSTRRVRERGAGGLLGRVMIEVTACPSPKRQGQLAADAGHSAPAAGGAPPAYRGAAVRTAPDAGAPPWREEGQRERPRREAAAYREPPPREADSYREPPAREPAAYREPPLREAVAYREPPPREPPPREAAAYREPPPRQPAAPEPPPAAPPAVDRDDITTIRNTLVSLEERVSTLPEVVAREVSKNAPEAPGLDAEGRKRYGWLLTHGVEEPIARKLAAVERAVRGGRGLEMALGRFLQFRDPLAAGRRVIALVGPTGVGKTTTLAKIAADLLLNRGRSVGFITLDTFRVGAVAQLETYANILQVRLIVARSPSEVRAGIQSLRGCDHILVDTVGSSPYNQRQVNTTGELLPAFGEDREVLLCMAGNVRETEQRAIFRRFLPLKPTGLVFTKLDETVTYGGVLNVALRSRLPLTVFTDGQRVPENLGWLSAEGMAAWFAQPRK